MTAETGWTAIQHVAGQIDDDGVQRCALCRTVLVRDGRHFMGGTPVWKDRELTLALPMRPSTPCGPTDEEEIE